MPEISDDLISDIMSALAALTEAHGDNRENLENGTAISGHERTARALDRLTDHLIRLSGPSPAADGPDAESPSTISAFFDEVGRGVVAAQRQLDAQSRDYMNQVRDFPPTMFRLPRASAEIKFGMSEKKGGGFNIFIASRTDEREESMQHSVSFDVVAAPLPPDVQAALESRLIEFPLVANRFERDEIQGRLKSVAADEGLAASHREAAAELARPERFDRALVISLADVEPGTWAIVEPRIPATGEPEVDVTYLGPGDVTPRTGKVRAGLRPVVALLVRLGAAQADRLRRQTGT